MLHMGLPVGAGSDATRVASYNPWVALYWLVAGKTVGGTPLYGDDNRLDRMEALRRYTVGSAWFSGEDGRKGAVIPGQLADLAVLSADYFSVPEEQIKDIASVLTLVGGRVVHASAEFAPMAPPPLPVLPDWSPARAYHVSQAASPAGDVAQVNLCCHPWGLHGLLHRLREKASPAGASLWGPGCECFAF